MASGDLPDLRVDAEVVNAAGRWGAMTYIVQRKARFGVVAYDGIDTITGREDARKDPLEPTQHRPRPATVTTLQRWRRRFAALIATHRGDAADRPENGTVMESR